MKFEASRTCFPSPSHEMLTRTSLKVDDEAGYTMISQTWRYSYANHKVVYCGLYWEFIFRKVVVNYISKKMIKSNQLNLIYIFFIIMHV